MSRTRGWPDCRLLWFGLVLSTALGADPTPWLAVVTSEELAPDAPRLLGLADSEVLVVAASGGRLVDDRALATARYAVEQLGVGLLVVLTSGEAKRWQELHDDIAAAWRRGLPQRPGLQVVPALLDHGQLTWGQPLPPPATAPTP
ncbi:MAG: hypothetical protein HUU35_07065, partial [Armatimonadetes bacterium]|nr:hypothetical protein [Armatimonadota bacterium]